MSAPSRPTAYLAVDLGSSSVRVMLGVLERDAAGAPRLVVTEAGRLANVPVRRAEGLGWDVPALWDGVVAGLRAGVVAARDAGAELRGIGVDSWGVDYARLTADGDLRPFVRHHRAADVGLAARTAAARDLTADYAITGVLDQAINTAHQLRQDAVADIGSPDDTLLLVADLFVYLLTGTIGAEATLASTTALFDATTGDWSAVLRAEMPVRLPRVAASGSSAGRTSPEVTKAIGADRPIAAWSVTAHDTAAAFFAVTDADDAGTGVVSSGSWAVVGIVVPRPVLTDEARLSGFTQERAAAGETLLVANLSGMWLLQQTLREWEPGGASIETLRALLAEAGDSDYAGRFDPADPALQAPGDLVARLEAACEASGAVRPQTRADLVRAIVDSLATAYADALERAAQLTGRPFERIRIVGGGARNELLCSLTAERSGRPVVAGPVEASTRGVLLQLAIAAGDLADAPTARAVTVDDGEGPERHYLPTPIRTGERE